MEHNFNGPRYTVGIEEELMILDAQTLDLASAIDAILGAGGPSEHIKPELLESVLEIATSPCSSIAEAGAELAALRAETAGERAVRAFRSEPPARIRSPVGRTSGWSATTATAG